MTDWATLSSLATGAGTLVLAIATFASVRSSNRAARTAEQALAEQRRPVLVRPGAGEREDDSHGHMAKARLRRQPFSIDLLYSDQVGEQRTISRFSVIPAGEDRWLGAVTKHWNLDGQSPRG